MYYTIVLKIDIFYTKKNIFFTIDNMDYMNKIISFYKNRQTRFNAINLIKKVIKKECIFQ